MSYMVATGIVEYSDDVEQILKRKTMLRIAQLVEKPHFQEKELRTTNAE